VECSAVGPGGRLRGISIRRWWERCRPNASTGMDPPIGTILIAVLNASPATAAAEVQVIKKDGGVLNLVIPVQPADNDTGQRGRPRDHDPGLRRGLDSVDQDTGVFGLRRLSGGGLELSAAHRRRGIGLRKSGVNYHYREYSEHIGYGTGFLNMRNIRLVMLLVMPCLAGCLNPDLVSRAAGGLYPTAPGNEEFVQVRLINETTATLDVPIVYDDGSKPSLPSLCAAFPRWPGHRPAARLADRSRGARGIWTTRSCRRSALCFRMADRWPSPSGGPALQAGVDFNRGGHDPTLSLRKTGRSRLTSACRLP